MHADALLFCLINCIDVIDWQQNSMFFIERMFLMIRSRALIMVVVATFGMHKVHASITGDLTHLAAGVGIVSGCKVVQQLFENREINFTNLKGIITDQSTLVVGAMLGFPFTTYGRTLRARLNLWMLDEKLMFVVMEYYASDADFTQALEQYCIRSKFPLMQAYEKLASQHYYLVTAGDLLESVLEEIPEDCDRAESIEDSLTDIYAMRAIVEYALNMIRNDAQWSTQLVGKNAEDMTCAMAASNYQIHAVLPIPIFKGVRF